MPLTKDWKKDLEARTVVENTEKAKLCIGCKFLHIGELVDHNHCDYFKATETMKGRVNGKNEYNCSVPEEKRYATNSEPKVVAWMI